jgi:hypothetical protein
MLDLSTKRGKNDASEIERVAAGGTWLSGNSKDRN